MVQVQKAKEDTNGSQNVVPNISKVPKPRSLSRSSESSQSSESNDQNLGQAGTKLSKLQTLFVGLPSIHLVNNSYLGLNRQGMVRGPFLAYNVGRSQAQERSAEEIAAL